MSHVPALRGANLAARTLVGVCCLTWAAFAQTALSGPFGFLAVANQMDSAGATGGAIVGLINFDGAGKLTGKATIQPRGTLRPEDSQAVPAGVTGTYSSNVDGTISLTLNYDIGFSLQLSAVAVDGGQGLLVLGALCNPCIGDFVFRGTAVPPTVGGGFPVGLLLNGASGAIPLTLNGTNASSGAVTVLTAAPATGSGVAKCQDGSDGKWTADIPNLTIVVNPALNNPGAVAGNFMASVIGDVCGNRDFETVSGLVTGAATQTGVVTLSLHAVPGAAASGLARAVKGATLNGSYGFQASFSPYPSGLLSIMKFDGAGNVTITQTGFTASGMAPVNTVSGTYTLNDDGTGTMTINNAPSPNWAFVLTDGGTQLLMLRTNGNPQFDVAYGVARLQ